jgi:hypothetical protein
MPTGSLSLGRGGRYFQFTPRRGRRITNVPCSGEFRGSKAATPQPGHLRFGTLAVTQTCRRGPAYRPALSGSFAVRMLYSWLKLAAETLQLTIEAQHVMGLRLIKIAAGGAAAQSEASRMVTEKITAAAEALGTLATGGSGRMVVRRYRTHVNANRRRLNRRG